MQLAVQTPRWMQNRPVGKLTPFIMTAQTDSFDARVAQMGDENAFMRLIRRHEQSLHSHLHRFTDNEAVLQDLRQETYLEAFRSLSSYRHEGPFVMWLRRIASRVGYRYWAGQAREVRAKNAYIELQRYCVPDRPAWLAMDDVECVGRILASLGSRDRTLVEMRYVQGLKATEIANKMGWNVDRVRVRLHRTLRRLRDRHRSDPASRGLAD